jgi:antitoxin HigA-1
MKAIHPGEHLAVELKEMGMSAAEFSRQLSVPTNRVTQILNGRQSITGDTALRLAHFFGTSAEFWLDLQSLYEIRLAPEKVRAGDQNPAHDQGFSNRGCALGYGLRRKSSCPPTRSASRRQDQRGQRELPESTFPAAR